MKNKIIRSIVIVVSVILSLVIVFQAVNFVAGIQDKLHLMNYAKFIPNADLISCDSDDKTTISVFTNGDFEFWIKQEDSGKKNNSYDYCSNYTMKVIEFCALDLAGIFEKYGYEMSLSESDDILYIDSKEYEGSNPTALFQYDDNGNCLLTFLIYKYDQIDSSIQCLREINSCISNYFIDGGLFVPQLNICVAFVSNDDVNKQPTTIGGSQIKLYVDDVYSFNSYLAELKQKYKDLIANGDIVDPDFEIGSDYRPSVITTMMVDDTVLDLSTKNTSFVYDPILDQYYVAMYFSGIPFEDDLNESLHYFLVNKYHPNANYQTSSFEELVHGAPYVKYSIFGSVYEISSVDVKVDHSSFEKLKFIKDGAEITIAVQHDANDDRNCSHLTPLDFAMLTGLQFDEIDYTNKVIKFTTAVQEN